MPLYKSVLDPGNGSPVVLVLVLVLVLVGVVVITFSKY